MDERLTIEEKIAVIRAIQAQLDWLKNNSENGDEIDGLFDSANDSLVDIERALKDWYYDRRW